MTELEQIPDSESASIATLTERLKAKIIEDNAGGIMRRDAHPKMHGLVQGEFTVMDKLPAELAVGLFKEAKSYSAWVRFSNQNGTIQPDIKPDIRGMAVKLLGVAGEKLLDSQKTAQTHDFILISSPAFVTKDVAEFDGLVKALTQGGLLSKLIFFLRHYRVTWNLFRSMKKFANPLQIRYFSSTPYLFGQRAVKYSAMPQAQQTDSIPENSSENFLREAMVKQLASGDVVFDFCVQFQTDATDMPVEDPGKTWDEKRSPFHKVATIRIPQQAFATVERDQTGENLSFNPWHALPEHRPLGGVNRARRIVYEKISDFRHQQNGEVAEEPKSFKD